MVSVIKPVITECSFEGRRWSFPIRWVPFRIVESKSAGHQKRAYQSSEGNNVHEGNAEKSFFLYRLMYTHVYTKKKKKKSHKVGNLSYIRYFLSGSMPLCGGIFWWAVSANPINNPKRQQQIRKRNKTKKKKKGAVLIISRMLVADWTLDKKYQ